jgi:methionine synthase I (cobalamin-dependent)
VATRADALRHALTERVQLLDGGLGSLLIADGLPAGRAPEWWLLERPERIAAAHRAYAEAGSQVVHAVTFGASPPKLEAVGLAGRCREANALAVRLAREAVGEEVLVAGDVGPTGLLLPPMGEATEEGYADAFREQVEALAEGGADLLSVETMYDLREALAAVRASKETGLPVFACMTFEKRKRGFFTIVGDRPGPSLTTLAGAGADAVGFNCSLTSTEMVELVRQTAPEVSVPLMAQPNAGQPRATPEGVVYDASAEEFASDLLRMVEAGARIVGGCCGTDPAFIQAAREALDTLP